MNTVEILVPFLVCGLVWLWFDGSKAREAGTDEVRKQCKAEGLQLLDETIVFASLRPARSGDGWIVWRRVYEFEYSDTGDNRRRGSVQLLGAKVMVLNLGLRLVASNKLPR